jgi:hypothetical protein
MIPTAEQIVIDNFMEVESGFSYEYSLHDLQKIFIKKAMIEFAKLHVEQALKEASKKAKMRLEEYRDDWYIDEKSILNAYSLENIK